MCANAVRLLELGLELCENLRLQDLHPNGQARSFFAAVALDAGPPARHLDKDDVPADDLGPRRGRHLPVRIRNNFGRHRCAPAFHDATTGRFHPAPTASGVRWLIRRVAAAAAPLCLHAGEVWAEHFSVEQLSQALIEPLHDLVV